MTSFHLCCFCHHPSKLYWLKNIIYCVCFSGIMGNLPWIPSVFWMAVAGHVANIYHFPVIHHPLIGIGLMTLILFACQQARVYGEFIVWLDLMYVFIWFRKTLCQPGVCNVCTIMNCCAYLSYGLTFCAISSLYYMIEMHFRTHPVMMYLDMLVWCHFLSWDANREDEQDDIVLAGLRYTVGWIVRQIYQSFVQSFWFLSLYAPLFLFLYRLSLPNKD